MEFAIARTDIRLSKYTELCEGEIDINIKLNKELTKKERDLIADAAETFFNQISQEITVPPRF